MITSGTVIQNFKIVEHLGSGGMGEVYKVIDISPEGEKGEFLALKVLRVKTEEIFNDDTELKRSFKDDYARYKSQSVSQFKKEAGLLFKLRHQCLPRLYKYFSDEEQNTHYIVMDYIEGRNLSRIVNSLDVGQFIDEKKVLKWTSQLLELLKYMHYGTDVKIIYRDLKPSNIIVDVNDNIKIVDFGISKIFNPDKVYISKTITVLQGLGTFEYMPLEQYPEANKRILPQDVYLQVRITDERSDIFALGGTLYYLLTRAIPVPSFYRVNNDFLTRPSEINPSVHAATERVVMKALSLLPRDRYQNIGEMKKDLERCFPSMKLDPDNASNCSFRSFRESIFSLKILNENLGSYPIAGKVRTDVKGIRIKPDCFEGDSEINFYVDSTKVDPGDYSGKIFVSSNVGDATLPFSFHYALKTYEERAEMTRQDELRAASGPAPDQDTGAPPEDYALKGSTLLQAPPLKERYTETGEGATQITPRQDITVKILLLIVIILGMGYLLTYLIKPELFHPRSSPSPAGTVSPSVLPVKDSLFTEIDNGNVDQVNRILAANPALINEKKEYTFRKMDGGALTDSYAPIHRAILSKSSAMVALLISRGADIHIKTKLNGVTPLHIAAAYNLPEIAKILIDKGADVNDESTQARITPLHNAAEGGYVEMAKLLLDRGARVDAKDHVDRTPLHNATYRNHKAIVELLLNRGANVNAKTKEGQTPLKFALLANNKDMAAFLRKHGGKE